MAMKKYYIGGMGPYLYDDTDSIDDADGDFDGETRQAFVTDGTISTTYIAIEEIQGVDKIKSLDTNLGDMVIDFKDFRIALQDDTEEDGVEFLSASNEILDAAFRPQTDDDVRLGTHDYRWAHLHTVDLNVDGIVIGIEASDVGLGNVTNVAIDNTSYDSTSWNGNADGATKNAIRDKIESIDTGISTHAGLTNNPHSVNKTDINLGNVPNTDATDRANHTGTQVASTISDFDTEVSNNTDVDGNTTHKSSDGSDHSYIDQDVTSGAEPTFNKIKPIDIAPGDVEIDFKNHRIALQDEVEGDGVEFLSNSYGAGAAFRPQDHDDVRLGTSGDQWSHLFVVDINASNDVWIGSNCSADSYTTRSSFYNGNDAIDLLKQIQPAKDKLYADEQIAKRNWLSKKERKKKEKLQPLLGDEWKQVDHTSLPEGVESKVLREFGQHKKTGEEVEVHRISKEDLDNYEVFEKEVIEQDMTKMIDLMRQSIVLLSNKVNSLEEQLNEKNNYD